ncbi:collagen alpha-2(I) chain-like [Motacilla alba alba]|uniref:collagen alpha-2(I) chain-like n=1 Tax=Motacilla alba alba TaxID=1094192 RepID=UPI0018D5A1AD|nr:collagen alpha-2(I) chain-like [Motacilla alba alba]
MRGALLKGGAQGQSFVPGSSSQAGASSSRSVCRVEVGLCRCIPGRFSCRCPGPKRSRAGARLAPPGELLMRRGIWGGRAAAGLPGPRRCEPCGAEGGFAGPAGGRGGAGAALVPAGAGRSVRSGRGARAPPGLPGPGAGPAGQGAAAGALPARRRPCAPEEPPEEPLSCREPRSVRRRERGERFWKAVSVLLTSRHARDTWLGAQQPDSSLSRVSLVQVMNYRVTWKPRNKGKKLDGEERLQSFLQRAASAKSEEAAEDRTQESERFSWV